MSAPAIPAEMKIIATYSNPLTQEDSDKEPVLQFSQVVADNSHEPQECYASEWQEVQSNGDILRAPDNLER
jgi:hypothetical protein